MEELLPPREDLPTLDEKPQEKAPGRPWYVVTALRLLACFIIASTASGLLWDLWRPGGLAFLGLAVSSLVSAYLVGSD